MADRKGRTRYLFNSWPRDPNGPWLDRPPPAGKRTPDEQIIWGHTVNDFFWIERKTDAGVVTMWSRSMIQDFGENYKNIPHEFEPMPRKLRPWPLLQLPKGFECESSEELGLVDEGCRRNHTVLPVPIDELEEEPEVPFGSAPETHEHSYRFSTVPKLEEYIPVEFFPDILMVSDADQTTNGTHSSHDDYRLSTPTQRAAIIEKAQATPPLKYRRHWPTFPRDEEPPTDKTRVAHLDLSSTRLLGQGNHSWVHRASLKLPEPLSARSPTGTVTVAAKVAINREEARDLLSNEARIYDLFPRKVQEGWCGLNLCTPVKYPVPVGAAVPKFFGYYVPVRDKEWEVAAEKRWARENVVSDEEEPDSTGTEPEEMPPAVRAERLDAEFQALSPILLLEECGVPVKPEKISKDDRSECISLIYRLHWAGFVQQSFHTRNILIQPGPLTSPPYLRSYDTPSFRIIDFGRGRERNSMRMRAVMDAGLDKVVVDIEQLSGLEHTGIDEFERVERMKKADEKMNKMRENVMKVLENTDKRWKLMMDNEIYQAQDELQLNVMEM